MLYKIDQVFFEFPEPHRGEIFVARGNAPGKEEYKDCFPISDPERGQGVRLKRKGHSEGIT
jgi:hypothetical protein